MKSKSQLWTDLKHFEVPVNFIEELDLHPLAAQALLQRQIDTIEKARAFLDSSNYQPAQPSELPGLIKAVERIEKSIINQETIGIWGDFDVDGQTATAVLVEGLQRLGAKVVFHLPVRERESHGVNLINLKPFLNQGVRLLITCDTGITADDAVDYAKSVGIDTLITDHHTLPAKLPNAFASVNPQMLAPDHALSSLCGVGCAYKVIEALFQRAGRGIESEIFLDLVALGTIADLALLTGDCRYLVIRGLQILRDKPRPAFQAILEQADFKDSKLTEEHISFILAPRLNAIGRLDDANPIIPFFSAVNLADAYQMAVHLEGLNWRRKLLCDQVFKGIQTQIRRDPKELESPVLILNHPQWPAGVIGIVASRLVDLYHRPVVLISSPPGETARASARSVSGVNITHAIAENQQFLLGFGGHPMAAGFSIDPANIADFRKGLIQSIKAATAGQPNQLELVINGHLTLEDISSSLVDKLDVLAPFGPGNPPLVLVCPGLTLKSWTTIGKNHDHLLLNVENAFGNRQQVMWWQGAGAELPENAFDLAFSIRSNNYRGKSEIQIEWIDSRPAEEKSPSPKTEDLDVLDYRTEENPLEFLKQLGCAQDSVIWYEGEKVPDVSGVDRFHLSICETLIILTIPPGPDEMHAAIKATLPRRVVLFALSPYSDLPEFFLNRLAGVIRFCIKNRDGQVSISGFASATGHRELTIRKGIRWMIARGYIHEYPGPDQNLRLGEGGTADEANTEILEKDLRYLLKETAAFRSYYRNANLTALINFLKSPG